jgi:hypothetical protein
LKSWEAASFAKRESNLDFFTTHAALFSNYQLTKLIFKDPVPQGTYRNNPARLRTDTAERESEDKCREIMKE